MRDVRNKKRCRGWKDGRVHKIDGVGKMFGVKMIDGVRKIVGLEKMVGVGKVVNWGKEDGRNREKCLRLKKRWLGLAKKQRLNISKG